MLSRGNKFVGRNKLRAVPATHRGKLGIPGTAQGQGSFRSQSFLAFLGQDPDQIRMMLETIDQGFDEQAFGGADFLAGFPWIRGVIIQEEINEDVVFIHALEPLFPLIQHGQVDALGRIVTEKRVVGWFTVTPVTADGLEVEADRGHGRRF